MQAVTGLGRFPNFTLISARTSITPAQRRWRLTYVAPGWALGSGACMHACMPRQPPPSPLRTWVYDTAGTMIAFAYPTRSSRRLLERDPPPLHGARLAHGRPNPHPRGLAWGTTELYDMVYVKNIGCPSFLPRPPQLHHPPTHQYHHHHHPPTHLPTYPPTHHRHPQHNHRPRHTPVICWSATWVAHFAAA